VLRSDRVKFRKSTLVAYDSSSATIYIDYGLPILNDVMFVRYWVRKLLAIHRKNISEKSNEYNRLTKALNDIRNQEAFQVLEKADVIAMTTTGAAKYRDMIYKLPVKMVILNLIEAISIFL